MNKKILIVDDNRAVRQSLAYIIRQNGFETEEAEDGIIALNIFKMSLNEYKKPFDLVITDINMPNLDGIGLVKKIRELGSFVPILILTTESERDKVDEGRKAGATGWLVKPFNAEKLMATIFRIF